MTEENDNIVSIVMAVLLLAALGLIAMIYLTRPVLAAECLSKEQARAKWPKAHVYWHTAEHCWDNKPGRGGTYGKREPEKEKPKAVPIPAPPPRADVVKENEFNELDAQAGEPPKFIPSLMPSSAPPAAMMLNPVASTQWQSITDPDVMIMFTPWELRAGGAFAR